MNLQKLLYEARYSYWPVPALVAVGMGALAAGLLAVDGSDLAPGWSRFYGDAAEARDVMSTLASAVLTFTTFTFSVTIVVLQLTSSQFSPRVLQNFLRDRRTQATLGVFTGTFVYDLVVLRSVRGADGGAEAFVPGLSVTVGYALAVVSVGFFVQYVHHVAQSVRVANIIQRIGSDTRKAIERMTADGDGDGDGDGADAGGGDRELGEMVATVTAPRCGVVTSVNVGPLTHAAAQAGGVVEVAVAPGEFVPYGTALLRASFEPEDGRALAACVVLEPERSIENDVAFGFRQLVDIAERALSPGVNDPTTASQCLDQLHDLVGRLGRQRLPDGRHYGPGGALRVVQPAWSWDDLVHVAFDELRHWGAGSLQVHQNLRHALTSLIRALPPGRHRPLREQLDLLEARRSDLPAPERPLADRRPGPQRSPD